MKSKKIIIPVILVAAVLITAVSIFMITRKNPEIEPITPDDGSLPTVEDGDYIATDYPRDLPVEAVSGVLGSLTTYVDNILSPDFDTSAFLDYSYQNQILRFNVTERACEATLVTKDNASNFKGDKNPLRSTKQLVTYAANSGHTINDLTITDEKSTVGVMDFPAYLDGTPGNHELSEQARKEIIKYCSDMLSDNRDTELYILSDNVIAFVMCERYSEESLLGSFSFLEKGSDDVYRLRTVIDFNC